MKNCSTMPMPSVAKKARHQYTNHQLYNDVSVNKRVMELTKNTKSRVWSHTRASKSPQRPPNVRSRDVAQIRPSEEDALHSGVHL